MNSGEVDDMLEPDENNGMVLNGHIILPELLTSIFVYVPDVDLLKSCNRVCRAWCRIIDGHHLWKTKAKQAGSHIPRQLIAVPTLPRHIYRAIAVRNLFGSNLLKNPHGKDKTNHWKIIHPEGRQQRHGWLVENPPVGSDDLGEVEGFLELGVSSCFTTTYYWCEKVQEIDLYQWGVTKDMVTLLLPKLYVCEWYSSRFDCASHYSLWVELRNNEGGKVGTSFEVTEDVMAGSPWIKVEHTFEDLTDVRYIVFKHGGKDLQFWAGHYGSKMTGATVKLLLS